MDNENKIKKQQAKEDEVLLELNSMINDMNNEACLDEEKARLREQLKRLQWQYRLNLKLLKILQDQRADMDSAKSDFDDSVSSVSSVVDEINKAIKNAEEGGVKLSLTQEATETIKAENAKLLADITSSQTAFIEGVKKMFSEQRKELRKITSEEFGGVYLSQKTFTWFLIIFMVAVGVCLCENIILVGNWIATL